MHNYEKIRAWELGHRLTLAIYRSTASFPPDERFGLVSQMRRSASSIPMNIAEGAGRDSPADFARFVAIACGSANELLYQVELARDLSYLGADEAGALRALVMETRRVADRFRSSLRP